MVLVTAARRASAGPLAFTLLTVALAGCEGSTAGRVSRSATPKLAPAITTRSRSGIDEDPYADQVISRVQTRQLAAFALLRTPPEGLPPATQRVLRRPIFGSNWRLAQRIPAKAEGTYWLVPGNGYLCVISQGVMGGPGVGTTCASTAQAVVHGIAACSITPPGVPHRVRLIVGVAPDGTRAALVHMRGVITGVSVHGGVFVLRDSTLAPPDFISLR
jgi:hypothetical protein